MMNVVCDKKSISILSFALYADTNIHIIFTWAKTLIDKSESFLTSVNWPILAPYIYICTLFVCTKLLYFFVIGLIDYWLMPPLKMLLPSFLSVLLIACFVVAMTKLISKPFAAHFIQIMNVSQFTSTVSIQCWANLSVWLSKHYVWTKMAQE